MNLGQAGEIGFILLVPLIFRKVGYRGGIVLALLALVFRNASFALSSAFGLSAFNFSAILIHGLIFGLLVVGSQMFVDEVAPPELRNQAQGLVNLLTAGVGVFASNVIFDTILGTATPTPWTLAYIVSGSVALVAAAFGLVTGVRRCRRE